LEAKVRIGVLALQGGFIEHVRMLERLEVETFEIRNGRDLSEEADGLILPGGESTAMGRLLADLDMYEGLRSKIGGGMPVFGTCAGMILLARSVAGAERAGLGVMDIAVRRNGYGRQLSSFYVEGAFNGAGDVPMTFIRAPYIESAGPGVEILSVVDGRTVAAREGWMLATAFHPELNGDPRIHQYFIKEIVLKNNNNSNRLKLWQH
jgi:5'-phosphate synthase pdxT subunit